MVRPEVELDKGIKMEVDGDYLDSIAGECNGFAGTGLADESPEPAPADIAGHLADAADDYQAQIAELEREAAERPLSIEEAKVIVEEELPKRLYNFTQLSSGYVNAPHASLDYFETTCTLRDVMHKQTWTGPNWRDVLNQARTDLCQTADDLDEGRQAIHQVHSDLSLPAEPSSVRAEPTHIRGAIVDAAKATLSLLEGVGCNVEENRPLADLRTAIREAEGRAS